MPSALVGLLLAWTVLVVAGGPLINMDLRIRDIAMRAAADPRWSALTHVARLYTQIGDPYKAGPVLALVALAVTLRRRDVRPLVYATVAVSALIISVLVPKLTYHRTGPNPADPGNSGTGFYPSGHTTTLVVCYGTALLLAAGPSKRGKRWILATTICVAAITYGAALVWCDYHWTSDVVAGWMLGALLLWAVFATRLTSAAAEKVSRLLAFAIRQRPYIR